MLSFQPLTLEDIPILKEYCSLKKATICDHTFGTIMTWRNIQNTERCLTDSCLILRHCFANGGHYFSAPLGEIEKGLDAIAQDCEERGVSPVFSGIAREDKNPILLRFPALCAEAMRDWFDYRYFASRLMDFSGKSLSGQRNHRNAFLRANPQWEYCPITPQSIPEIMDFLEIYSQEVQKDSSLFLEEQRAVIEVLEHFEEYGMQGGFLRIPEGPIALSIGEVVGDTVYVHVEKALRSVRGAYPMIVSEFLKHCASDSLLYVNREEDMGEEGLRFSKNAYCPESLIPKYMIR